MLKRSVSVILALVLALSFSACASADGPYKLPEALKTAFASADSLELPELPAPVAVTAFNDRNGEISVHLDGEVPHLKITELDFMTGKESTVYSQRNTDFAKTHSAGKGETIHTVILSWELDGYTLERTYNTWFGELRFDAQRLIQTLDPAEFAPYTHVTRELSYNEAGNLSAEVYTLLGKDQSLTRTVSYTGEKALESVLVSWKSLNESGTFLEAAIDPAGNLTYLHHQEKWVGFLARSQKPDQDMNVFGGVRADCFNISSFDEQLRKNYPQVASLVSTATDLPAAPEPVPDGARLWALNVGDYLDSTVYVFLTADPFLVYDGSVASVSHTALDVNGNGTKLDNRTNVKTPVFELPEVKQ